MTLHADAKPASIRPAPLWLPGLLAVLVGIGIARFAYTPLLPALVAQNWLTASGAAYVGAANLAGYLAGAAVAQGMARIPSRIAILNGAMLAAAISLFACAADLGFWWMLPWRFVAGVAGAMIMILGPSTVLARTPAHRKGRVSGLIFSGVGIGIILSGTALPALSAAGLPATWSALGAAALVLSLAAWRLWPEPIIAPRPPGRAAPPGLPIILMVVAYGTDGIGFVPHTLFLSDFVARGLALGEAAGGLAWAVFGAGALVGAPLAGMVADRIGLTRCFVLALAVKSVAVALPLVSAAPAALAVSALVVGALTPGMVALASGLAAHHAGPSGPVRLWGAMTIAFALFQAAGGYAMSALFARTHDHLPLFALGAGMLAMGAVLAGIAGRYLARD